MASTLSENTYIHVQAKEIWTKLQIYDYMTELLILPYKFNTEKQVAMIWHTLLLISWAEL